MSTSIQGVTFQQTIAITVKGSTATNIVTGVIYRN